MRSASHRIALTQNADFYGGFFATSDQTGAIHKSMPRLLRFQCGTASNFDYDAEITSTEQLVEGCFLPINLEPGSQRFFAFEPYRKRLEVAA